MRRPGIIDLLGLALILGLLIQPAGFSGDPGMGWHLKSGEWILLHLSVPRVDPFLLGLADQQPWIHTQWLADLLFALIHELGGWPLLHAFGICLLLLTWVGVVTANALKTSESQLAATGALLLSALMGATQWILRPVLFSFLFFALCLSQIQKLSPTKKSTWSDLLFWCVFFSIWAQLHPAFVLGLALLGCACLGAENKTAALIWIKRFFAALAGSLLNPYGAALHRNILKLSQSKFFMNLNVEWLSPDFHSTLFWPFLLSLALLLFLGLTSKKQKLSRFEVLSLLLFAAAGLVYRRYIPFFGIVAAAPLAKLLAAQISEIPILLRIDQRLRPNGHYALSGALLVFCYTAVAGHLPLKTAEDSAPNSRFPEAAIAVIGETGDGAPIFHTPDWGGFITLSLWPRFQAFIDDRNELIGEERYKEFFQLNRMEPGWEKLLEKYQFGWLLLSPASPLAKTLQTSMQWEKVFEDDKAVVLRVISK